MRFKLCDSYEDLAQDTVITSFKQQCYNLDNNLMTSQSINPHLKVASWDWKDDSVIKNNCCSCSGSPFNSQHPHRVSQLSITPVQRIHWVSGMHIIDGSTCGPNIHTHKIKLTLIFNCFVLFVGVKCQGDLYFSQRTYLNFHKSLQEKARISKTPSLLMILQKKMHDSI